jgi:ABC-type amino acid transport system permease subunit
MRDNETIERKATGCGVTLLITILAIVVGLAAAIIFVLFNIGAWIGGH